MEITIKEGDYKKFGVCEVAGGYVFTFVGEREQTCYIRLYDKQNQLMERILVPKNYCMGSVRSVFVSGIKEKELRYNYEINGVIIQDEYADRVIGREQWNNLERIKDEYCVYCGKEKQKYDWEDDDFPEVPKHEMVMYKLHVRGFSMDGGAKGKKRGTFAAVSDKIEYLKELGVTTVEFMPVYEFEELVFEQKQEIPEYIRWQVSEEDIILPEASETKEVGLNYWGYGPGDYFAVKTSYAGNTSASKALKELVKKMHKNGMECVLEMFFPAGMNQNVILDVLRFWVREYHVDGFHLLGESVPVKAVCQDVFLSRTKLFCEEYDGWEYEKEKTYKNLYVYNDQYLYPARKLLNHMGGSLEEFANQQRKQHQNIGFVNYITNNNGFTMMDLFSYHDKHNEDNGEGNADGNNWNFSNNCGFEGKTGRRYVNELRKKQIMNAFAMLFFAQGVPLIMAGDEMGNSQNGNNNAYCQDNRVGWLNWKKDAKNAWLIEFVKKLSAFRKEHQILHLDAPMQMNDYGHMGCPDLSYHGENAWISGLYQETAALGMMYCGGYAKKEDGKAEDYLYVGYNFHMGINQLALPKLPKKMKWFLVMDTSNLTSPFLERERCLENQQLFQIKAQSTVVLVGK